MASRIQSKEQLDRKLVAKAFVEPGLDSARPDEKFQFERHGHFVADRKDHAAGNPVFDKIAPA